jgi:hypothetical protein
MIMTGITITTSTATTSGSAPSVSREPADRVERSVGLASMRWRRCGRRSVAPEGDRRHADRPDQPVVLHGVQHLFHPPVLLPRWPSEDRRTRMVFITRGLPQQAIEESLTAFAEADSPLPFGR